MSTVVTMSSTVGQLVSGQTFIVRTREAEQFVANSQATKGTVRGSASNVLPTKTGVRSK